MFVLPTAECSANITRQYSILDLASDHSKAEVLLSLIRVVVIFKKKKISLPELLQQELSVVPWSLAKSDGTLARCKRGVILDVLNNLILKESSNAYSKQFTTKV